MPRGWMAATWCRRKEGPFVLLASSPGKPGTGGPGGTTPGVQAPGRPGTRPGDARSQDRHSARTGREAPGRQRREAPGGKPGSSRACPSPPSPPRSSHRPGAPGQPPVVLVVVLACLDSQASVRCDMRRPGAWRPGAWRPGAAAWCLERPGLARRKARPPCDSARQEGATRLGGFWFRLARASAMSPRPPPIDLSPNQKKNTVGYALCRREWSSAPAR